MRKKVYILLLLLIPWFLSGANGVLILPFDFPDVTTEENVNIDTLVSDILKTSLEVMTPFQTKTLLEARGIPRELWGKESTISSVGQTLGYKKALGGSLEKTEAGYLFTMTLTLIPGGGSCGYIRFHKNSYKEMITELEKRLISLRQVLERGECPGGKADDLADLYVKTDPPGGEIFLNGISRGTSPQLLTVGAYSRVFISAGKGQLKGEQELFMDTEDYKEITLKLRVKTGRLFIDSPEENLEFYLDGKQVDPAFNIPLDNIPEGQHDILIKNNMKFFNRRITIQEDRLFRLTPQFIPYGNLNYTVPREGVLEIPERSLVMKSSGELKLLPAGKYVVKITGERYEPLEEEITIIPGETLVYRPHPEISQKFIRIVEEERLTSIIKEFEQQMLQGDDPAALLIRLEELKEEISDDAFPELKKKWEELLEKMPGLLLNNYDKTLELLITGISPDEEMISKTGKILDALEKGTLKFPGIQEKYKNLLEKLKKEKEIQGLMARKARLEKKLKKREKEYENFNKLKWISFSASGTFLITSGISLGLGQSSYNKYEEAALTSDAVKYREETSFYRGLSLGTGIGALLLGGSGLFFMYHTPDKETIKEEILQIDLELIKKQREEQGP